MFGSVAFLRYSCDLDTGPHRERGSTGLARQRYKVVKKIDAGGMAEIFVASAQSVGGIEKTVAIKRVLPSLTKNKRFVNMFLDEARLSMVLTHANIVQVFDVGRADDTYYIVMEYVDGYNLRRVFQRMSEQGFRIPVPLAAYLLMEVCKGLAHAHDQRGADGEPLGIVHRDISPPNILISKSGEVKITDFGLAKAVTQLEVTDPGIVKGKFSYLSPEAANGKTVDHRADIFAVGILLWEVLACRRLFLGKSDMETVELIRKAEVPSLSLFNHEVSDEFEKILEKALTRDVKHRWHAARDLGDALAKYLFAHNMKVTSYDLAEMLSNLFAVEGTAAAPAERIGPLIDEEVLHGTVGLRVDELMMAESASRLGTDHYHVLFRFDHDLPEHFEQLQKGEPIAVEAVRDVQHWIAQAARLIGRWNHDKKPHRIGMIWNLVLQGMVGDAVRQRLLGWR